MIHEGDRVFRALSPKALTSIKTLESQGLIKSLTASDLLIGTTFADRKDPTVENISASLPEGSGLLEHTCLPFISYPAEWSISMLIDAGLLTLQLQEHLALKGFTLKDASAYNVAFMGSKPIFIDASSIESTANPALWNALGQFYRMFLYPLLLAIHRGSDLKGYFLANIDGLNADKIALNFGAQRFLNPGIFLDVTLPAWFSRSQPREFKTPKPGSVQAQLFQLRRLRKILKKIRRKVSHGSSWVDYTQTHTYANSAEDQKIRCIKDFLSTRQPESVADLGCNTGTYTLLAAKAGAHVFALDNDHDSIDLLYRNVTNSPEAASISPLWVELVNPTPGIGFRNQERAPLLQRCRAQAVFALALVHHLLVTARIPLALIVEQFASLTDEWLVVEYIEPRDSMFRSLAAFRGEIDAELTESSFTATFERSFTLDKRVPLDGGTRVLMIFRKR